MWCGRTRSYWQLISWVIFPHFEIARDRAKRIAPYEPDCFNPLRAGKNAAKVKTGPEVVRDIANAFGLSWPEETK